MTEAEARKLDVEIANLNATTAKLIAETSKLASENAKLLAESRQLRVNTFLAPFLAAAAVIGATAAFMRIFFG